MSPSTSRRYVIGSRGSELAMWQAEFVQSKLRARTPADSFEIKVIKTVGDSLLDVALSKIGDKGLFTKQIEVELLSGNIDLAVHSLKDLQTTQPDGLAIGAVCKRETPNDAFISRRGRSIDAMPQGARIATGSLRRRSQLLHHRPDLNIVEIRGNVPTRLEKFHNSELDGLVLASAGLTRLGLDGEVSQLIPFDIMLPAVGQGALAIEVRTDDPGTAALAAMVDDAATSVCITAERAFLRRLEGGCQVPIGALATLDGDRVTLDGMVGSLDGSIQFRERSSAPATEAETLGVGLAETLIELGANNLLAAVRATTAASAETVM